MIDIFQKQQTFNKSALLLNIDRITAIKNPYIGNKRKLLYDIYSQIEKEKVKYNTVLDPFSGSAACSMMFKSMGKIVHSNDILQSSHNYSSAFVMNNNITLSQQDKDYICNNKINVQGLIYKKYSQIFEKEQADQIQRIRMNIWSRWGFLSDSVSFFKHHIAMANLQLYIMQRSVVGRLSSGQVMSKIDFRKNHHMNAGRQIAGKNIYHYNFNDPSFSGECVAYNQDAIQFLSRKIDAQLIYIDPPYGGSSSDYSTMYNFFEDLQTMNYRNEHYDAISVQFNGKL